MEQWLSRRRWLAGAAGLGACRRNPPPLRGFAFVACEENRSLSVIDLNLFAFRQSIELGGVPERVLLNERRGTVYALAPAEPAVYEIDAKGFTRGRRLALPSGAVAMAQGRDGWIWCLLRERRALAGIHPERFRIERTLPLGGEPAGFDLAGDEAAVALRDGSLVFAGLAANRVSPPVWLARDLGNVRFRFDGQQVLAADRGGRRIVIVDVRTRQIVVQLQLAVRPDHFCFKGDGGQLFLTGEGRDAVVVVYPYRAEVALTQLSGRAPGEMAASVDPDFLFVANPSASSVTIFDIETQRVLAVAGVGTEPARIVITPDQQYALVLNHGSGDIAVIRTAAIAPGRDKSAPLFTMIPTGAKPRDAAVLA